MLPRKLFEGVFDEKRLRVVAYADNASCGQREALLARSFVGSCRIQALMLLQRGEGRRRQANSPLAKRGL